MDKHPEREAALSKDAAWWLVPVAFAAAALAAVAVGTADQAQSHAATGAVQPVKANSADVKPVSINPPAPTQPRQAEEPVYEVEHVQAF